MTDVNLMNAEVLRVGPDEVLILKITEASPEMVEACTDALERVGLGGRSLVVSGVGIDLVVVEKNSLA